MTLHGDIFSNGSGSYSLEYSHAVFYFSAAVSVAKRLGKFDMVSVYESMLNGGPWHAPDPDCIERAMLTGQKLKAFNATPLHDMSKRQAILKDMLLSYEPGYIIGPLTLEYGHLELESGVFMNADCMFLDNARISIKKNTMIGPRCLFTTSSHSLDPTQRMHLDENGIAYGGRGTSAPIVIEDHVWLGANVTVLPGVTIGARSTIGAGSVVLKTIPPDVLAFGNPCRVQRSVKTQ
jgi:maltose O-acetyltransferase